MKHMNQTLGSRMKELDKGVQHRHPSASKTLYSAAGVATLHASLGRAIRTLVDVRKAHEGRLDASAGAMAKVKALTRSSHRLRGAIAFANDLLDRPLILPPPAGRAGSAGGSRPISGRSSSGRQGGGADSSTGASLHLPREAITNDVGRRMASLKALEDDAADRAAMAADALMVAHANTRDTLDSGPGSRLEFDGSAVGPLAGRVHCCEGALDAVAELESGSSPRAELSGVASMLTSIQSRTLLAMVRARMGSHVHVTPFGQPSRACIRTLVLGHAHAPHLHPLTTPACTCAEEDLSTRLDSTRLDSTRPVWTRLASPRLASPRLASTRLDSPRLASTRLNSTCLDSPCLCA